MREKRFYMAVKLYYFTGCSDNEISHLTNWHDMVGGRAKARETPEVSDAQASSSGGPVGILWGSYGDPVGIRS